MQAILKNIIFYTLMFVRTPFMIIGKILGIFLLIFSLVCFLNNKDICGALMIAISFGTFMLRMFYDQILLKINPTNTDIYLSQ